MNRQSEEFSVIVHRESLSSLRDAGHRKPQRGAENSLALQCQVQRRPFSWSALFPVNGYLHRSRHNLAMPGEPTSASKTGSRFSSSNLKPCFS